VLVNNAAVIQVGPIEHLGVADFEDALATNFWGAVYATLAALPHLRRQAPDARVVNVTSIGGTVALPHMLPYVASKHALVGLSDGLRAELAREGVRVTTVVPGLMRTGSHVNASFKGRHRSEFAWFTLGMANPLLSESAADAAERIVEACRRGDSHLTITAFARALTVLNAVAPDLVAAAMELTTRLLPGPTPGPDGDAARSGWESRSPGVAPSPLTRPADRAIAENNNLRGHSAPPA
jgi:NAD(P)-dependent dehydrogenase (short-subunit alcohol dehydrogenase family)